MKKRKKGYPHNSNIMEIIMEILNKEIFIKPEDFYDKIRAKLEEKGFKTSFLTTKRVWRIYEEMVKKKIIYDFLEVMKNN
ncbi:MAG: hypothetical protein NO483_06825 [Candidatus Methanomethylicia archaeon]|nr:hypothetical protein [Candidatus Methanomethylicia archaeon]